MSSVWHLTLRGHAAAALVSLLLLPIGSCGPRDGDERTPKLPNSPPTKLPDGPAKSDDGTAATVKVCVSRDGEVVGRAVELLEAAGIPPSPTMYSGKFGYFIAVRPADAQAARAVLLRNEATKGAVILQASR